MVDSIEFNLSICNETFTNSTMSSPPVYLQGMAFIVYTLLSILTVGGNALVCLIVFHYMEVASVTNLFIANLALTDIFIGVFCIPIVLVSDYLLSNWPFGLFMCKFTSLAQSVVIICTVYTLISMSVDRYIAIIHPLYPKLTRKKCYILIIFLWSFAIVFSLPTFFEMRIRYVCYREDINNTKIYFQTMCETNGLPSVLQRIFNATTLTIMYIIPLCVLSTVYIRLGLKLSQIRAPGEAHVKRDAKIKQSKRKAIKMCFIVVIMFGVCWLPMQLYANVLRLYLDGIFDKKYVPHFYFAFHLMAMSSSCINPIIYAIMSSRFRSGYIHYWRCLISCCKSMRPPTRSSEIQSESISLTNSLPRKKRTYQTSKTNQELTDGEQTSFLSYPSLTPPITLNNILSRN